MYRKVTLKQIAELAGTSIGTVDRALNERGRINPETKEKILEIAKQLDYKPNVLASSLSKSKKTHIGVIMAENPKEFSHHLRNGLKDAFDEVAQYGVTVEYITTSSLAAKEQMEVLEAIDVEQFDAFLVNAGSKSVGKWIDKMAELGKTVITFNTDIEDSKRLCYVGENSHSAGLLIGNLIDEIIPKASTIGLLLGFNENHAHRQRCEGVKDAVLSLNPHVRFIEMEYEDDAELARVQTLKLLKEHSNIDAIFGASATGVWGIGKAVSELSKEKRPKVFGYDVGNRVAELMDLDLCQASLFQNPYWQGYYSMKLLVNHLVFKHDLKREKYVIRSVLVLKSNIRDYLKDRREYDGFLI